MGMEAADNTLLNAILMDLLPGIRRLPYASLMNRAMDLKKNAGFFRNIVKALALRDVEMGVKTMKDYIANERSFALESIDGLKTPD